MEYKFLNLQNILSRLKDKLRIAVIYASNKHDPDAVVNITKNTRPWKSYELVANNIAHAIRMNGFKHTYVLPEDIHLLDTLKKNDIHMVWINSAGVQGLNPISHAPALLEMAGIPYIGHNPLTATVLDNKHHFKRECQSYEIATGRFMVWDSTRGMINPHINSIFKRVFAGYSGPFVIKPVSGRASLGVSVVEFDQLAEKVAELYQTTSNTVIIEEYLSGPEYCVSVSGPILYRDNSFVDLKAPFVFSELERVLEKDELIFTSMDVKPISGDRARLLDPKNKDSEQVIKKLHEIARTIYLDFNLHTLVRIDVRADAYGNLFVLEANPKPDLKAFDKYSTSLVALGLDACNMSYTEYIYSLLANGLHHLMKNRADNIAHILELI